VKFGSFPTTTCEGAYLVHSLMVSGFRLKKGQQLTSESIAMLVHAGVKHVVVVWLDEGDIHEDVAAEQVAQKLKGANTTCGTAFTGRVNLYADMDGVLDINGGAINALNAVDESMTVATLHQHTMVTKGQMVATSKIIPFAVPSAAADKMQSLDITNSIVVRPYLGKECYLIQTELETVKSSIYEKTSEIVQQRIVGYGGNFIGESRSAHEELGLARNLLKQSDQADIILVMGASAITDRQDVIPAAITAADGHIIHFGMPVDPGNLLLVARLGDTWVLGLPGCARSPKLNGVDYILARLCAGMDISSADIMGMGVGGLLSDYIGRPHPRSGQRVNPQAAPRISIAIMAAGRSRRMGAENKLLLPYGNGTVLEHVIQTAKNTREAVSGIEDIFVVTGHDAAEISALAVQHQIRPVHNADYASGMSSSVKYAVQNVPTESDAVLILLGDMPAITKETLCHIMAAFDVNAGRTLIMPVHDGKQGNPVLWGRAFFKSFDKLHGDKGAKALLSEYYEDIHEVDITTDDILLDIDTLEAYEGFKKRQK